jgi:formate dehydrogenase major subunit
MRAGLPDRRADAGARGRAGGADKQVESVCPYCGVGCQLTYNVKDNKILSWKGATAPPTTSRLCVKGRYGFDYAHHPHRLTVPLIRRADAPKRGDFTMDPERVMEVFREASWEEALELAGGKLAPSATPTARNRWPASARPRAATKKPTCSRSWCAPASAATTSTTAPACATPRRSRAARRDRLGRGVEPGDGRDQGGVVIVIGANPTVNHPVAATWIKNAIKRHQAGRDATRAARTWRAWRTATCSSSRTPTSPCSTR